MMAFCTAKPSIGQELDATAHLSEIPLANSQESSFNDSVPSQSSPPRPMSSIQYQLSRGNYSARQITPSTSSSDPSSQGRSAERLKENLSAEDDVPDYSRPELQDGQNERPQNFYTSGSDGEHIHSQKRMADGQVKHASSSLPMSPVEVGRPHGRSDGGSVTSKSSQMGELSNHLKTRLSYAMVKVQNGWQTRSIDELESMTSQQASPVSPITDLRRPYDSPKTDLVNMRFDRTGFAQSSERTTATPEIMQASPQLQDHTSRLDYAYSRGNDMASPKLCHSDRTYESFWREHSASNTSKFLHTENSTEGPSLAPPADIQPRNARRSEASVTLPLGLQMTPAQSFSSSGSAPLAMPATPPQRRAAKPRTPSQNAAMEQDAVETLLFMSSPGNPGYHPPAQVPARILRNQLSAVQRTPGLASRPGLSLASDDQLRLNRPTSDHLDSRRLANDADIDKLLDEMPDGDSSSDEDDLNNAR